MKRAFPLQSYMIRCMRRVFAWYPPRRQVKMTAQRGKNEFECAACGDLHHKVFIDHIDPVVDVVKGFQGYDEFIKRLFCPIENLQALCKSCHNKKSKAENAIRRANRVR